MSCIYDVNKEYTQVYSSQEHIIPACIGGIKKLEHGFVCDHVNNKIFSKLELEFARHSIIDTIRPMIGPGKRGSNLEKYATSSKLQIMEIEDKKFILCKLKLGKPFYEEQIHIRESELIFASFNHNKSSMEFLENIPCKYDEYTIITDEKLNKELIISKFDNKFYIIESDKCKLDKQSIITQIKKHNFKNSSNTNNLHTNPIIHFKHSIDYNIFNRVLGKIAFNTMAYLFGENFVKKECFNDFRNWILGKGEDVFSNYNANTSINWGVYNKLLPKSAHSISFDNIGGYFICWINLYGMITHVFRISFIGKNINVQNGFICDWSNKKEYTLYDYVFNSFNK